MSRWRLSEPADDDVSLGTIPAEADIAWLCREMAEWETDPDVSETLNAAAEEIERLRGDR